MKFEYTIRQSTVNYKVLLHSEEDLLTNMGHDGWELCCVMDLDSKRRSYYFKRLIVESPSLSSEEQNNWINIDQYLPGEESYYEVKFDDNTTDEKPFRIRYSKNIIGFMTEKKVTHWRPLLNT